MRGVDARPVPELDDVVRRRDDERFLERGLVVVTIRGDAVRDVAGDVIYSVDSRDGA